MLVTLYFVGVVVMGAGIGGVFVWFFWPYAMPAAFPGLVEAGYIAESLTFWESLALSFLSATLFKATSSGGKKG